MENSKKSPEEKGMQQEIDKKVNEGLSNISTKYNVPEEDEYNIEIIEDRDHILDPFIISNKDSNYEYRFLRFDDNNLGAKTGNLLYQKGGWQIVPRQHLLKLGIAERLIGPDGLYRVGDTVLARIPKELYVKKKTEKNRRANEPMDQVERLIKDGDSSSEITTDIGENMKGLQTKEKLKM